MTSVTRKFEWDAAHRVLGHQGKCRHLHGHRYVAEVTVQAPELNDLGMVVDFAILKSVLGTWIDDNWDHTTIFHPDDPLLRVVVEDVVGKGKLPATLERDGSTPITENPTAENIASFLFYMAKELLPSLKIKEVKVWETPNCWASYKE